MVDRGLYFVNSLFIILMFLLLINVLHAEHFNVEGNLSLWWDIYENNENGIMQPSTREPAADVVSGFNLKQGRIIFNYEDEKKMLGAKFQLRLEEHMAKLFLT